MSKPEPRNDMPAAGENVPQEDWKPQPQKKSWLEERPQCQRETSAAFKDRCQENAPSQPTDFHTSFFVAARFCC
jgi:hypothetical protein